LQTALQPLALSIFTSLLALACSSEPSPGTPAPLPAGNAGGGQGGAGGAATGGGAGTAGLSGGGSSAGGSSGSGGSGAAGISGGASGGGGGGSGGASAGSAGSAGSGGASVSGCSGVTSKFCDDFEAQTSGQPPAGAFDVSGDGIVVDASKAFSGTQAVHITSAAPTSTQWLEFTEQFPMNDYHGRAMFFLQEVPQADFHWDILQSHSENGYYWEIGGMYQDFILVVDPPDHGLGSDPFPGGEWFCLQWQFKYGGEGQPNTFVAKKNGVALMNGEFTGPDADGQTWNAGPWENLQIGWTAYGSSDVDLELWIDDLAIGEQEIPCPTP